MKQQISWNPYKHGITKSLIEVFRQCPEKARLRYIEMLEGPIKSEAIDFGNYAHEILHEVYGQWKGSVSSKLILPDLVSKTIESIYNKERDKIKSSDTKVQQDFEVTLAKIKAIMPTYFEVWQRNTTKYRWLDLEKEFKFEFRGVPLVGKIDGAYEYKNEIYIFETKSKGNIDESSIEQRLKFEIQVMMYYLAVKELYGREPKGVNYNVIRRPSHRPGANETIQMFQQRLTSEVRKSPEHFFLQFHHTFQKDDVKKWRKEFINMIDEILIRYDDDIYYRDSGACHMYNRTCVYLPLCSHGDKTKLKKREKVFSELELV